MSSNDPEEIRAEIEQTRARLSGDVDTLTDEANPKTIARRQVDKVRGKGAGLRDRVMGSVEDAQDRAGGTGDAVRRRTEGNPLAAGLIAFGLGALVASLIPASEQEQSAAAGLKERAEPLKQQVTEAAKDAAANLKEPAQEAADAVKQTATDATENVKSEGQGAVQDVRGQAQDSSEAVRRQQG